MTAPQRRGRAPAPRPGAGLSLLAMDGILLAAGFLIVAVTWVALVPLRIWHVTGSDGQEHPDAATWVAYGVSGGLIVGLLMFLSIRSASRRPRVAVPPPPARQPRRPPGPGHRPAWQRLVEPCRCGCDPGALTVSQLRPPPPSVCVAPPVCLHRNAVRVSSPLDPEVTLANLCPDCDAQLVAGFRWSCCSAPPGNTPGTGHLYNCPHRKRGPR